MNKGFFDPTRTSRERVAWGLLVVMIGWLAALPVLAATPGGDEIDWLKLGMGMVGGLAFFLFGIDQMSTGLKAAAGETLKVILGRLTRNRFLGAMTGAFVTAILNSSTITTVLVVGFITAGLMSMAQSISVIMGANIGSTFTAQIMAFNITQYALFMVAGGFLMLFTTKREQTKHYGSMLMGLGLLFYGMGVMSEAMGPLRSYEPFIDLMIKLQNPLFGILVGTVFTALIQSSAATTGLAIVLASEGLMSLEAGIALAFGANLGTCVSTFALVSLGKPREAIRAAMVHVLFNVAGVTLWVFFIPQLAAFVQLISPSSPELEGAARIAAEVPRQIANAHTVFNVANTLLFIGFTSYFARVVEWMIPDKPLEEAKAIVAPKYLEEALVDTPSLALERVRLELGHMGEIIEGMLAGLAEAFDKWDPRKLEEVEKMDDQADILHEHILAYLGLIGKRELTGKEDQDLLNLMLATENLESIGDTIETDLVGLGNKMVAENLQPSDTVRQMLGTLYEHVSDGVASAVKAVSEEDERAAQEVFTLKADIDHQIEESQRYQAGRLVSKEDNFLPLLRVEMDLLEKLKRIHTLSKRMARTVLPKELREVT